MSRPLKQSPSNLSCPCPFKALPPADAQGPSHPPRGRSRARGQRGGGEPLGRSCPGPGVWRPLGQVPVLQAEGPRLRAERRPWPLPPPQAPSEAETAADLIDMGPEPAANGSLSSQLAGMSKYAAPLQLWGAVLWHRWSRRTTSRTSAQPSPHRGPNLGARTKPVGLPHQLHDSRALSGLRNPTVLRVPSTRSSPWPSHLGVLGQVP